MREIEINYTHYNQSIGDFSKKCSVQVSNRNFDNSKKDTEVDLLIKNQIPINLNPINNIKTEKDEKNLYKKKELLSNKKTIVPNFIHSESILKTPINYSVKKMMEGKRLNSQNKFRTNFKNLDICQGKSKQDSNPTIIQNSVKNESLNKIKNDLIYLVTESFENLNKKKKGYKIGRNSISNSSNSKFNSCETSTNKSFNNNKTVNEVFKRGSSKLKIKNLKKK